MIVMKFGGSSLATAESVRRCTGLVRREIERRPVVVVSAHGKTTDRLIEAADRALDGVVDITAVVQLHGELASGLDVELQVVEPLLEQLDTLLHGVSLIRELTPRTLDRLMSFGERMSTRMVAAALSVEGVPATAVNSYDLGLLTDSCHGAAVPRAGIGEAIAAGISALELVPVVTGFLGKDSKGNITTIGRSGSDFTASIVGAAIEAEEVQIWTDVDGVMTCNPSVEPEARSLPALSFDEASELAYYGAKVLHPSTLVPAIEQGIPVRVLNTMNPGDPGTVITSAAQPIDRLAKAVVYKEDVNLITIASPRLMSAVRLLGAALDVFAARGVAIHMATTSEATVSLVTDSGVDAELLEGALTDLRQLGGVEVEGDKTIICVVGEELKGKAGVLGSIFGAVAAHGIKAKMVSQSASELNVAFLVDNAQIETAVRALHQLLLD